MHVVPVGYKLGVFLVGAVTGREHGGGNPDLLHNRLTEANRRIDNHQIRDAPALGENRRPIVVNSLQERQQDLRKHLQAAWRKPSSVPKLTGLSVMPAQMDVSMKSQFPSGVLG
jgi:hypothetical protein